MIKQCFINNQKENIITSYAGHVCFGCTSKIRYRTVQFITQVLHAQYHRTASQGGIHL